MVPNVGNKCDLSLQIACIGPSYTNYHQLFIDNDFAGNFVARNSESALTSALEQIGVSKTLHVSRIMVLLMQLKSGEATVLATASSQAFT